MAGAAAINVIGLVSGLLGIYQFGKDNFGSSDSGGSTVRVLLGLDIDGGLNNAGGDLPDVRLFNEGAEFLGMTVDPGSIDDGTASDIKVAQKVEQQATYGLFTANDNAICIAYLSIVWPDEQKFGWLGDIGQICGLQWYYSNIALAGSDHKPACLWIDANGEQPITGFQVHFPDFIAENGKAKHDKDFYCGNGPAFKTYTEKEPRSILPFAVTNAKTKSRRGLDAAERARTPQLRRRDGIVYSDDSRLVMSSDPNQGAAQLCQDPVSRGPDFVNTAEGQFCCMSTKKLYPVCGGEVTDNCFNQEARRLVVGGLAARDEGYTKVIDWTQG